MLKEEKTRVEERVPAPLRPFMTGYLEGLDNRLPGRVGGAYLHGSIPMKGYVQTQSDIDLFIILNAVLDEAELDQLEALHRELREKFPQINLEVHYLQWSDLGRDKKDIPAHPYFSRTELFRAERHHLNPNMWWIIKHHESAIRGPEPEDLPYEMDWATVKAAHLKSLNRYWKNWTRTPRNLISLLNDDKVACWSVLGIARLYYNMREKDVTTKEHAANYILSSGQPKYERVVREALRIRNGQAKSYYRNRYARAIDAVRFINEMVRSCKRYASEP